ncbi:MAG: putative TonB-dependent receptor, partial [Verrucomicrobiales bacterium]|nr:putative TonB-dependent receptor [Verrucomicrobiales bacterium]
MEQKPRRKKNSTKINATISLIFHGAIIALLFFVAAREGMLGKQLKKIAVTMAPKEKPPEKPKEKPPEPKVEPPKEVAKTEAPKAVIPPPARVATAPPPATTAAPPPAAPPAGAIAALDFSDGAKIVQTT